MLLSISQTRAIATLCVAVLLCAQVLGLHYHRQLHLEGGAPHAVELHFADSGLHDGSGHDDHDHGHEAPENAHPHLGVDTDAPEVTLAKVFLGSILPALLFVAAFLLLPLGRPPRPRALARAGGERPPCYSLGPPSQAPPLNFVCHC